MVSINILGEVKLSDTLYIYSPLSIKYSCIFLYFVYFSSADKYTTYYMILTNRILHNESVYFGKSIVNYLK